MLTYFQLVKYFLGIGIQFGLTQCQKTVSLFVLHLEARLLFSAPSETKPNMDQFSSASGFSANAMLCQVIQ